MVGQADRHCDDCQRRIGVSRGRKDRAASAIEAVYAEDHAVCIHDAMTRIGGDSRSAAVMCAIGEMLLPGIRREPSQWNE